MWRLLIGTISASHGTSSTEKTGIIGYSRHRGGNTREKIAITGLETPNSRYALIPKHSILPRLNLTPSFNGHGSSRYSRAARFI